jgi:hypothetical protein
MEYQIGISCRPNYLRPSIDGLHTKIVERDTMDEVMDYIDSCLDDTELMQQTGVYWTYFNDDFDVGDWHRQRFGVMEFKMEDGYEWSIDFTEQNEKFKDDYKEPGFTYRDIDE